MKHLKTFNESSTAPDQVYSKRDKTNQYFCALGWVRYTEYHKDSYIDIKRRFNIDCKQLGDILLELVDTYDLYYHCRIDDDENKGSIVIDLLPTIFDDLGHSGVNFQRYMKKHGCVIDKDTNTITSGIGDILFDIDESLEEYGLTIKNRGSQGYMLYITSSQITLVIEKK